MRLLVVSASPVSSFSSWLFRAIFHYEYVPTNSSLHTFKQEGHDRIEKKQRHLSCNACNVSMNSKKQLALGNQNTH
uniref:Uncharacterized protein n=1 Tax=Rhipicephalus pulchellus TaxID=72859 RepID=L7LXL9_RHIPC